MKILHILWSGEVGGIERLVYDLSLAQQKMALQPQWLLGHGGGYFNKKAQVVNIPVTALKLNSGFDLKLNTFRMALDVMKEVDVLHYHGFTPVLALPGWLSKKPFIYTEHGNFGLRRKLNQVERFKKQLLPIFINQSTYVTANSRFTANFLMSRYRLKEQKLQVIYNGVDFSRFDQTISLNLRNELGISDECFCIGTICRLVGFKRVDRLINSFSILQSNGLDSVLIIVGDGPLRLSLENQAAERGLSEKIYFLGIRNDIPEILAALDAFVISSQGEPFGLTAVEAMAQNLPILAFSDGGGAVELVERITPALIVDDEEGLARSLLSLAANPVERIELGNAGHLVARQFSIESTAVEFNKLYASKE